MMAAIRYYLELWLKYANNFPLITLSYQRDASTYTWFHGLLKIVIGQVNVLTQYVHVGQGKRSMYAGGSVNLSFLRYE